MAKPYGQTWGWGWGRRLCDNNIQNNITNVGKKNPFKNVPPETGASIKTAPIFSAAAAISFETFGSMVLESMRREPFFTFLQRQRTNPHASSIHVAVVISARVSRVGGALEDAVDARVDLYDVGTGGQHGDDAVSLFCDISGIVHNL